jgi:hypothetical protein
LVKKYLLPIDAFWFCVQLDQKILDGLYSVVDTLLLGVIELENEPCKCLQITFAFKYVCQSSEKIPLPAPPPALLIINHGSYLLSINAPIK